MGVLIVRALIFGGYKTLISGSKNLKQYGLVHVRPASGLVSRPGVEPETSNIGYLDPLRKARTMAVGTLYHHVWVPGPAIELHTSMLGPKLEA